MTKQVMISTFAFLAIVQTAFAQYPGWQHEGSLYILTTPEGADLPATASEEYFPLLVRLNDATFNFSQAKANGEDIRLSAGGKPLAYQIEEWDAAKGAASIWVRIPVIKGNARQEIKLHWGKADAKSESKGSAVFNAGNGYASVLHMDEELKDELGAVQPADTGTSVVRGMIGKGRHLVAGKGVNCGETITTYPTDSNPHSSEAWFRAEAAGADILGWGNQKNQGKVVMQLASPPYINLDCYFSGANVTSKSLIPLSRWIHVVHTYKNGDSRVYVNGRLDGHAASTRAPLAIRSPASMCVGGWQNNFSFAGDIDEVRVSRVARSADWIKLQYANQKPLQTLVGCLVQPGSAFSVTPGEVKVSEGQSVTVTAQAGDAQKVYWIVKRDGEDTVVAVDQLSYTLGAGRVVADTDFVLQFKAVCANEVKVRNLAVKIKEEIPEPVFYLRAPAAWNGRDTIEVVPAISNLKAMKDKGVADLKYRWSVSGGAVIKEIAPDKLLLKRSQCSGKITVKLALNNGGADFSAKTSILVTEPKQDAWVQRTPGKDEKPEDNQFYARDDNNEGTLYYNGTLDQAADSVFLKLYADDKLIKTESQKPAADKSYAFTVKLRPGLIKYKVEFGAKTGGAETVLKTVNNLVCGDAYIIDGQSNAEATGPNNGPTEDPVTPINNWIRSYGNQLEGTTRGGWGNAVRTHIWGKPNYGDHQIGAWGIVLAKNLVEKYQIPICIINGAYGGTPIWRHQPNPANHYDTSGAFYGNPYKIYGCHVYQVWPLPCSMGPKDDQIREAQRTLPSLYSNLRNMSTVGAASEHAGRGSCHFDLEGYAQFARFPSPLVEQDNYGLVPKRAITAPNLKRAWFTSAAKDEIALDFGQLMAWKDEMKRSIYLDDAVAPIGSGSVFGEAVFSTRCWVTASESGIRFTRNKENTVLYAANLGWSNDQLRITTLGSSRIDLKTPTSVSLLGAPDKLTYTQDAEGLSIKVPKAPFDSPACAFKLTFSGQIPTLTP